MNKLMAFILSLTLICWQIHIPAAMAQTEGLPSITEPTSGAEGLPSITEPAKDKPSNTSTTGTVDRQKPANATVSGSTSTSSKTDIHSTSLPYLNSLTMIVSAYVAMRMLVVCAKTAPDVVLGAIGAASLVYSVISQAKMYKKKKDEYEKQYLALQGKDESSQIEEFVKMKKMYEEMLDAATELQKLQRVAAGAFFAAGATALASAILMSGQSGIYNTTIASEGVACAASTTASGGANAGAASAHAAAEASKAAIEALVQPSMSACSSKVAADTSTTLADTTRTSLAGVVPGECSARTVGAASCAAQSAACAALAAAREAASKTTLATRIAVRACCVPVTASNSLHNSLFRYVASEAGEAGKMLMKGGSNVDLKQFVDGTNIKQFKYTSSVKEFFANLDNKASDRYFRFKENKNWQEGGLISPSIEDYKTFDNQLERVTYSEEKKNDVVSGLIANGIDLVFPRAQADNILVTYLGLSAAVVVILVALSATTGFYLDTFIGGPYNRAIIWGVLGGLAMTTSEVVTQGIIDEIEDRKEKIETVISRICKVSGGKMNGDICIQGLKKIALDVSDISGNKKGQAIKPGGMRVSAFGAGDMTTPEGEGFPCIVQGGNSKGCGSVRDTLESKFNGLEGIDLGSGFGYANSAANFGDSLSGAKNFSANMSDSAAKLAQGAVKMKKLFEDKEKQLINLESLGGQKSLFADRKANFLSDLLKRNENALKGSNSGTIADLNRAFSGNTETNKVAVANKTKAEAFTMPSFSMPTMTKFKTMEEEKTEGPQVAAEEKVAALDQYEDNSIDIVKGPDVSIFTVISTRYFKTGWDRLLERNEVVTPPLALPEKK